MSEQDITDLKAALGMDKKKPLHYPLTSISEVLDVSDQYQKPIASFMFKFLYLSGQRISEFLATRRQDITTQDKDGKTWLILDTMTEKNRQYPRRIIPMAATDGLEKPFADYVLKYLEHLDPKDFLVNQSRTNCYNLLAVNSVKIKALMTDNKTYQDIFIKIYPHYLRHNRAAHLVKYRGYDIYKLMAFFGWRNTKTPTIYAKLDWRSLAI